MAGTIPARWAVTLSSRNILTHQTPSAPASPTQRGVSVIASPSLFDFAIAALYNLLMTKTVNEKRAKTVFAELVGRVSSKKDTVIVEQHGKPVVAMIDFDRYQLLTEKRERRFNVLDHK